MTNPDQKNLTQVDEDIATLKAKMEDDKKKDLNILMGLLSLEKTKDELIGMGFDEEDVDLAIEKHEGRGTGAASPTGGPTTPTPEALDSRSPEEKKLDETREEYTAEYLKARKELGLKNKIALVRSGISDFFKSKDSKKHLKEEDFFTQEYKDKKEAYDKARVEMGQKMFDDKKAELMAGGTISPELDQKLAEYKSSEILGAMIIDERQKVIDAKVAASPNASYLKQGFKWYMKQNRLVKIAISGAVFGVAAFAGGAAATAVAGSFAWRVARSYGIGLLSTQVIKVVDLWNKKGNAKFEANQEAEYTALKEKFGKGEITQKEYEYREKILGFQERDRARNQMLAKAVVGGIFSFGAGWGASHAVGGMGHHGGGSTEQVSKDTTGINTQDTTHQFAKDTAQNINTQDTAQNQFVKDSATQVNITDTARINHPVDSSGNVIDSANAKAPIIDPNNPNVQPVTPPLNLGDHKPIEVSVGKGHGAIQTIKELQQKLNEEYPDKANAPLSVQHLMNTQADKLAIEYGMFKPGETAESAFVTTDDKLVFDKDGNLSFTDKSGNTTILEKGIEAKGSGVFAGKMHDTGDGNRTYAGSKSPGVDRNYTYYDTKDYKEAADYIEKHPEATKYAVWNKDLAGKQTTPPGASSEDLNKPRTPWGAAEGSRKMPTADDLANRQTTPVGVQSENLTKPENINNLANQQTTPPGTVKVEDLSNPNDLINKQTTPEGVKVGDLGNKQTVPIGARVEDLPKTQPAGDLANRQTVPAGAKLDNVPKTATSGTDPYEVKVDPNIRADQNIYPTKPGGFNAINSGPVIAPRDGIFQTGEETGWVNPTLRPGGIPRVEGAFTPVAMTNEELFSHSPRIEHTVSNTGGTPALESHYIEQDPRYVENVKEINQTFRNFDKGNVIIDKPESNMINGMKAENWNHATDYRFQEKKINFNSYEDYQKEKELQEMLGTGEQKIVYDEKLGQNVEKVYIDYFRDKPEWKIESKIPAKYYFDFDDVKYTDGKPLTAEDFNKLLKAGVLKETVITTNGVNTPTYAFSHKGQLERLQEVYQKLTPKEQLVLGNDKPIGDETLEKYVERLTKKVYAANDGTLYGVKGPVNWDQEINRSMNTSQNNIAQGGYQQGGYQQNNSGSSVIPGANVYPEGDYGPNSQAASRAVNLIRPWWRP